MRLLTDALRHQAGESSRENFLGRKEHFSPARAKQPAGGTSKLPRIVTSEWVEECVRRGVVDDDNDDDRKDTEREERWKGSDEEDGEHENSEKLSTAGRLGNQRGGKGGSRRGRQGGKAAEATCARGREGHADSESVSDRGVADSDTGSEGGKEDEEEDIAIHPSHNPHEEEDASEGTGSSSRTTEGEGREEVESDCGGEEEANEEASNSDTTEGSGERAEERLSGPGGGKRGGGRRQTQDGREDEASGQVQAGQSPAVTTGLQQESGLRGKRNRGGELSDSDPRAQSDRGLPERGTDEGESLGAVKRRNKQVRQSEEACWEARGSGESARNAQGRMGPDQASGFNVRGEKGTLPEGGMNFLDSILFGVVPREVTQQEKGGVQTHQHEQEEVQVLQHEQQQQQREQQQRQQPSAVPDLNSSRLPRAPVGRAPSDEACASGRPAGGEAAVETESDHIVDGKGGQDSTSEGQLAVADGSFQLHGNQSHGGSGQGSRMEEKQAGRPSAVDALLNMLF